jgi:malonyl-CoA/methylmalonyl-CoA synthetase
MIFMHKFDIDGICQRMTEASVLMGVPTFFRRLLQNQELEQSSKNMRLFVSGSAPLLAQTHMLWRERTGHAILERYGMTETNMNTSNPYDGERRAGTVGFPLPGVEVIVTNPENGQILPSGEIGVLEVRGPNVFKGYWEMPEKTSEELRENGFFITGDLGSISEDGYVSIVGRSKDLIISGGYNIYPKEIEVLLDGLDGVLESALIGIPHPDFGEGVVAVIVPQSGAKLIQEDIMLKLKDQIARFKHPKRIVFIDELPRNTMGKVQKKDLRERFARLF